MDRCPVCGELLTVSTPEWADDDSIEVKCRGCGDSWIENSWSDCKSDDGIVELPLTFPRYEPKLVEIRDDPADDIMMRFLRFGGFGTPPMID